MDRDDFTGYNWWNWHNIVTQLAECMRENERLQKERDFLERAHAAKFHDLTELTQFAIEKGLDLSELRNYENDPSNRESDNG